MIPEFLYHYYDSSTGPFKNLSDLHEEEAESILEALRAESGFFAGQRSDDYLEIRSSLEGRVRELFIQKGGRPERAVPHYMTLGRCDWLMTWYPNPQCIMMSLKDFDPGIISFTYGDIFPAMRFEDGVGHTGSVFTMSELAGLIEKFGLPQKVNPDGEHGPKRYIEAQIWDDRPLAI